MSLFRPVDSNSIRHEKYREHRVKVSALVPVEIKRKLKKLFE